MKLTADPGTDTLPKLLKRHAGRAGRLPAMREKDRGIWQTYSWRACQEHVRDFALGLAAHGFRRGDKLSVLGDNRARLYWAQLAAQALGGMSVPLYQDSIASELMHVLSHAEVSVVVAEDQEQVDKVLSIHGELASVRLVIYEDPRGLSGYRDGLLKSFAEIEAAGRAFGREHPGYYEREVEQGCARDVALVAYTSGTTGRSKGVLLNHANMIATSESFVSVEDVRPGDNWLCYLPMGWVGDAMFSLSREPGGGRRLQLPGEPGDGAARPARARARCAPRPAAHLGEHADGSAGQGRRCLLAEAARLRRLPPRRRTA